MRDALAWAEQLVHDVRKEFGRYTPLDNVCEVRWEEVAMVEINRLAEEEERHAMLIASREGVVGSTRSTRCVNRPRAWR